MSFGRKGLSAREPMVPMGLRSAAPPQAPRADPVSPALAAFLAEERQRSPAAPPDYFADRPSQTGVRADDPHPLNAQLVYPRDPMAPGQYSLVLAYALWLFFASFGAHRHYLGARTSGAAMALLAWSGWLLVFFGRFDIGIPVLALFLLWMVVDLFLLPGLARRANNPAPETV
jgi:TM2 domain-containing membrane protein YozV